MPLRSLMPGDTAGQEKETLSVRPKRSRQKNGRDLEEKNYGDQDLQTDHTDSAV